jgi:hypothetical protein
LADDGHEFDAPRVRLSGAALPSWLIEFSFVKLGKTLGDVFSGRTEDIQHNRVFFHRLNSMRDVLGNIGEFAGLHDSLFSVYFHKHLSFDHDADLIVRMRMGLGFDARNRTVKTEHYIAENDASSTHACREGRTWLDILCDFIPLVKERHSQLLLAQLMVSPAMDVLALRGCGSHLIVHG